MKPKFKIEVTDRRELNDGAITKESTLWAHSATDAMRVAERTRKNPIPPLAWTKSGDDMLSSYSPSLGREVRFRIREEKDVSETSQ